MEPVRHGLAKVLRIDQVEKQAVALPELARLEATLALNSSLAVWRPDLQPVPEPDLDELDGWHNQEEHIARALPEELLDFQSDNSPVLVLFCRCDG